MALAKFLACAGPQFLQSGKEVKLLGLTRELGHWGWLGGSARWGEEESADGAKTASGQEERVRGLQVVQRPGARGVGGTN